MKRNLATVARPRPAGEIRVLANLEELSRAAASAFVDMASEAVANRGAFRVTLSGGSTPKKLYSLLAGPEFSTRIAWHAVHLFWGDERCVPPDDPESNYGMARHALLQRIPIPAGNVHRMRGEIDPSRAAAEYEVLLRESFGIGPTELPRFDLVLLGLGEDGHTASLFPGTSALEETERLAVAVYVEKLNAHRISLSLPVINRGAAVVFLVSGAGKRAIVARVLAGSGDYVELPAQRVRPTDGKLVWFLDRPAVADVSEGSETKG